MIARWTKFVGLLVVILIVTPSLSDVVSEKGTVNEADGFDMDINKAGPEMTPDTLQQFENEGTKGTSPEQYVEWGRIWHNGIQYKVKTYWNKAPDFFPEPGYYKPLWENDRYGAKLKRVAIYELNPDGSEKDFVTNTRLQQEIITAVQIQGNGAYERQKLDLKSILPGKFKAHDWIEDRHGDWWLIAMNEIDDTLLADEEDLSEKQIYKLLIIKTLDEEGCSPLSKEDFYSESAWYKDFFSIPETFLGDKHKEASQFLSLVEDRIDVELGRLEIIKNLNPFGEHCDIIVDAVWDVYRLIWDIFSAYKHATGMNYNVSKSIEIGMDVIDGLIRAAWEIKLVEKYADSLELIEGYVTDSQLKSAIHDLRVLSSNAWAHVVDVIIKHVESGVRKIGKDLLRETLLKHPYLAAAVFGLEIGLLITNYLVVDYDGVKGHSNTAYYLRKAEKGFLNAINDGLRQEVKKHETDSHYLSTYNLAEKLQLMASIHFYKEAKSAVDAYVLWNPLQNKNDVIKDIKNSIKNREELANNKVSWMWDSDNDIDYVQSLIRPMPNLDVDPSSIFITPTIPQFGKAFNVNVVVENKGDASPDFYVDLGIIDKSRPFITKTFQSPYLAQSGQLKYIPYPVREKNIVPLDQYHISGGLGHGESINITFEIKDGIWNDNFAGHNSLAVTCRFYLDGEWHADRVYKGIKINRNPDRPMLISPKDYAASKPQFEFVAFDPDDDNLTYELLVGKKYGTYGKRYNQQSDSTGWSKTEYKSGEIAVFNYPDSPLSDDDYYWWVKVHDDTSAWVDSDDEDFMIDTIPPTTSHFGDKGDYVTSWPNNWYNGNISLEAYDYGSGIAETKYRINDGSWITTTETQSSSVVVIDYDCYSCKLEYYSKDNAGHNETKHLYYLNIDLINPDADYAISGPHSAASDSEGNLWRYGWDVTLYLEPEDDPPSGKPSYTASGVGLLKYYNIRNDYPYSNYSDYDFSSDSDQKVVLTLSEDGLYEILYHVMDYAYNVASDEIVIRIDNNPPESTITNPDGIGDWYKSYPALISRDEGAGVAEIHYRIEGRIYLNGVWGPYEDSGWITETIDDDVRELESEIVLDDGNYTITYYAVDDVDRTESPPKSNSIIIDGHSPNTTYTISEAADYKGWYNRDHANLTINLSAVEIGPSGFWYTNVSVFDGETDELKGFHNTTNTTSSYDISWLFNSDGLNRIFYWSGDNAGNIEKRPYEIVKIDKTPPVTTYAVFDAHHQDPWNSWVGVNFYSDDATSGIDRLNYRINGGEWQTMLNMSAGTSQKNANFTLYLIDNQRYVIDFYAVDKANHSESAKTIYVLPDLTVAPSDMWMEGGNLYVEVHNTGYVDAHNVLIHLYGVITSPNNELQMGDHYLNSTIIPEVRAKKSSIACFLPREYIGLYNQIRVVIEKSNSTLPEISKSNNEAFKFIRVLVVQWIVRTYEEVENTVIVVPPPLCQPLIIEENAKLTLRHSDMVVIEPCPSLIQAIQVYTNGVLELINSGITVVKDVTKFVVSVAGYLIARGKGTLKTLLILAKELWIDYQEGEITVEPQLPSIWDVIDQLRNSELAFEPAPLPIFVGEPTWTIDPAYDPRQWTIQPALPPPKSIEVTIPVETNIALVDSEVVMVSEPSHMATLSVKSGTKLYLIDSSVAGNFNSLGMTLAQTGQIQITQTQMGQIPIAQFPMAQIQTGQNPASKYKLMGGGEIIQVNSQISDQISYGVKLETSSASRYVNPGGTTEYQLTVTNDGTITDTYDLTATLHTDESEYYSPGPLIPFPFKPEPYLRLGWRSWLNPVQVTLAPTQSANVILYVSAPGTRPSDFEEFRAVSVVKATSQGDTQKTSTIIVKTTMVDEPSILGGSNNNNAVYHSTMDLGTWAPYNIQISNTDDHAKELDLHAIDIPNGWAIKTEDLTIVIPPYETRTIVVEVRGPFPCCMRGEVNRRSATIVLIVESDDNEISAAIIIAEAPHKNQMPSTHIETPGIIVYILENVAFFACRSTDPDGRIINYRWEFSLGSNYYSTVYGGISNHQFLLPGIYAVTLRIIDNNGAVVTESMNIEVRDNLGGLPRNEIGIGVMGCGCNSILGAQGLVRL